MLYRTNIIQFQDLKEADLIVGNTYEGGTKKNSGDDPISKIMKCENMGGFRPVGARNGVDTKYCVLYSDLSHNDWPDRIDKETGQFTYYGDNRKVNQDIHATTKKGNQILRYSFEQLYKENRINIPPFFVFTKGTKGRDVVFLGLAVPGAASSHDALKIVEHKKSEGTIQNYEGIFTILDVRTISRAWIEDLHRGEPMTENAPIPWVNWIKTGEYTPLVEKVDYSISKSLFVRDTPQPLLNQSEIPTHIHSYIKSKGFNYSLEDIKNLYLSIKTKPFVILSGISGTGKTKIVQWLAESVGATEENKQFTLIPVRPDWNDGSDLLGYVDIKGEFKPGPLTKIIHVAEKNPNLPYFVLLDEMNLARVEHYFSDMLSVMESRKWKDGKMVTTPLLTEESAKRIITLPSNVYVLGTVNMDETTHPFSKKVLDRANTIEFNTVELGNLSFLEDLDEVEPIKASNSIFLSDFLYLKDVYVGNEDYVRKVTNELVEINSILQPTNSHFGYRVRDEICFYLYYNKINDFLTFEEGFDYCILQKILPRLSGSDQRTEEMLQNLYKHFTGREYTSIDEKDIEGAIYPKSAKKVVEMLRRLQDGFTSFWIS